jgi:hypothetical protein
MRIKSISFVPEPFFANIPKSLDFSVNHPRKAGLTTQNPSNPEVSSGGLPILLCMFQKKIYL